MNDTHNRPFHKTNFCMQISSDPSATVDEDTASDSFPISEDDVRTGLERIVGEEEARDIWLEACDAAQTPRPGPELGPEEITRVVEYLKEQNGTASVVGNSLSVKIRTSQHR